MQQYVIKSSGTIQDALNQIKTLQAIFGQGATLSTVATVATEIKKDYLYNVILNQFEKDGKKV